MEVTVTHPKEFGGGEVEALLSILGRLIDPRKQSPRKKPGSPLAPSLVVCASTLI